MRQYEKDFLWRDDDRPLEANLTQDRPLRAAIQKLAVAPDIKADLVARTDSYQAVLAVTTKEIATPRQLETEMSALYNRRELQVSSLDAIFDALMASTRQSGEETNAFINLVTTSSLVAITAIVSALSWLIGRGIARPIGNLTAIMQGLAAGDLNVDAPAQQQAEAERRHDDRDRRSDPGGYPGIGGPDAGHRPHDRRDQFDGGVHCHRGRTAWHGEAGDFPQHRPGGGAHTLRFGQYLNRDPGRG